MPQDSVLCPVCQGVPYEDEELVADGVFERRSGGLRCRSCGVDGAAGEAMFAARVREALSAMGDEPPSDPRTVAEAMEDAEVNGYDSLPRLFRDVLEHRAAGPLLTRDEIDGLLKERRMRREAAAKAVSEALGLAASLGQWSCSAQCGAGEASDPADCRLRLEAVRRASDAASAAQEALSELFPDAVAAE